MVSLVNSARVAAGKGGLGWLNPSLYKYSSRFANDIRKGNNRYTYYNPQEMKCSSGFEATEGWDPASGWGSLNFTKFKNLFLSFGNELNIPTAAPTATARPTDRPTKAAVWLYRNTYSETSCQGAVLNTLIVPVGVCLQIFQSIQSNPIVTGYKIYSCINGTIIANQIKYQLFSYDLQTN